MAGRREWTPEQATADLIAGAAAALRDSYLRPDHGRPTVALHCLGSIIRDTDSLTHAAVSRARDAGESWASIGQALGVTRQAAQQRFGVNTR